MNIKTSSSDSRSSVIISAKNFEKYVEAEENDYNLVLSEVCDNVEEFFEFVELFCDERDEEDDEREKLNIISSSLKIDSLVSFMCIVSTSIENSSVELVIKSTSSFNSRLFASSSVSSLRSNVVQNKLCCVLMSI
jgi:hypothetical protein